MSKKDFIALADALKAVPDLARVNDSSQASFTRYVDGQKVLEAISDFCASQNPRYLSGRWFAYLRGECGPSGGKV